MVSFLRPRRSVLAFCAAFVLALTLCAAGCGNMGRSRTASTASRTTGPDAYERSGRTPQLHITLPPAGSARPFPLIVALHSLYNDSHEPQSEWGFDKLAAEDGFAVVYPDGLDASWNAGTCCGQAAAQHVDDIGWLRALISHLEQHYPIDRHRVILVGFSNGGMLAYRYACEHAPEIAGIAVVAASLQATGCTPAGPVAVVAVHGDLDERVPYAGVAWSDGLGTAITSVEQSLAPFRTTDRCPYPSPSNDNILTNGDGLPVPDSTGGSSNGVVGDKAAAGASGAASGSAGAASRDNREQRRVPVGGAAGAKTSTAPSTAADVSPQAASKRETVCASGKRVTEFLLPFVAHGWPPVTGPAGFNTAEVIWRLLAPMRSYTPGPNL